MEIARKKSSRIPFRVVYSRQQIFQIYETSVFFSIFSRTPFLVFFWAVRLIRMPIKRKSSLVLQVSRLQKIKPPRGQVCLVIRMEKRLKKDCRKNQFPKRIQGLENKNYNNNGIRSYK